jgi:hypothetical protein
MTEAIINGIFPTPIYMSKLDRKLTSLELKFVDENKKDSYKNTGNITSNNTYIKKVISSTDAITPYITQSWLNYTETNQFHHKHEHPNSLVSGVFYINCHEEFDKIKFFKKDIYQMIKPEIKTWNIWNSESWWFTVKTGDLIMFPSSLTHMVENKEGTNTRISLAFNVFIKGTIGVNKSLTELIL